MAVCFAGSSCCVGGDWFFGINTPDSAPWFVKRLDFSRPSAQHRVAAWRGAIQMMRDHPFGVGWNKAVETYEKDYSPPEDGAAAITTNDYLMLGTQLGVPGLVCFVAYVWLCLRGRARNSVRAANAESAAGDAQPSRHLPLVARSSRLRVMAASRRQLPRRPRNTRRDARSTRRRDVCATRRLSRGGAGHVGGVLV